MTEPSTVENLRELLDREAVREVTMRYCRGVDRRDVTVLSSVFHSDAVDEHAGRTLSGPSLPQDILALVSTFTVTTHHITSQIIRIDGDVAGSESYYTAWLVEDCAGEERHWHTVGRYVDRHERRNGTWRIAHRVVIMETARYLPPPEVPAGAHLGLGAHDHGDPSYAVLGG